MARKKRGTSRKGIVHRAVKTVLGDSVTDAATPVKIHIVVKNLLLFIVLFVVSLIIFSVSNSEIIDQLFQFLAMLTGFIAVAFLIILLTFWFMKAMKK